ncbi:MAG: repeat-containing protein [Marmoricola sp.]|nr:repeat-containing protein [Marmoricola sp.]
MVLTPPGTRRSAFLRRTGVLAAVALPIALVGPAFATVPTVSFAPTVNYTTPIVGGSGVAGSTLVAGDFTGDGKDDVISLDLYTAGKPVLFKNNGDGTFPSLLHTTRIPVPNVGPLQIIKAAHFDAGPTLDLMVSSNAKVWVLLGNGDGTFKVSYTATYAQAFQQDATVADVDGDGDQDFIIKGTTGVRTWLNNGDGTFTPGIDSSYPVGSTDVAVSGIGTGDFNHDGVLDVAVSDAGTGRVYTMDGDGAGHFTPGTSVSMVSLVGVVPGTVLVGDFNHDGRDDVATINEFTDTQHNLAVALGQADGSFAAPTFYQAGINPSSGALADLNHDGNLDVVSSDTTGLQQVIELGNGDGTFTLGAKPSANIGAQTPAIGDFNGDGRPDIAVVGSGIPGLATLSIIRNTTP